MSNPFVNFDASRYNVNNKGIMQNLQSPLQEEFKDGDFAAVKLIVDYVPFMDCGDATLRVVRDLSQLSPTQAACIESKIDYCTAGGLGFKKKVDTVFKRQSNKEAVITDSEHNEYANFLSSILDVDTLLPKMQTSMRNRIPYGSQVVEVVLTQTAGTRGGSINIYDTAMFRFKRENEKVITSRGYISQRWDYYYLSRNANKIVEYAMYPAFSQHEDGTMRSLIYVKDEALYRNWYGLPKSFASVYFQFLEYQLGKYTTRGYENFWLPAAFIETFDMPNETDEARAEADARELVKKLANVYTNSGDGKKLPVVFRAATHGTTPTSITQFNPQTHENFHERMSEIAQKQILKTHGWHSSLLEKTAGSIGNNSENADIALITDKTVIRPLQENCLLPFRIAISEIEKWVGYTNPAKITIDLKSVFEAAEVPTIPNPAIIDNTTINAL